MLTVCAAGYYDLDGVAGGADCTACVEGTFKVAASDAPVASCVSCNTVRAGTTSAAASDMASDCGEWTTRRGGGWGGGWRTGEGKLRPLLVHEKETHPNILHCRRIIFFTFTRKDKFFKS